MGVIHVGYPLGSLGDFGVGVQSSPIEERHGVRITFKPLAQAV